MAFPAATCAKGHLGRISGVSNVTNSLGYFLGMDSIFLSCSIYAGLMPYFVAPSIIMSIYLSVGGWSFDRSVVEPGSEYIVH